MAKKIAGITVEIGGDTTKLGKALGDVNKTSRDLQSELKGVNSLLKLDPKNVELVRQKQEILKESIAKTSEKLNTLKGVQEQVQTQFDKGEITIEQYRDFQREIEATEQRLRGLNDEARNLKGSIGDALESAGGKMQAFGGQVSNLGTAMLPVTAAIGAVGTGASLMAADFEDAMAKVSTIADTSEVPLSELENQIINLSNTTGLEASSIAEDVYNAISAGQSTGDAVAFVGNAAKLAKAGFTDSASALDVLTTTMNAYGLEADQVGRVSDVLMQTQNMGKTTVGELASSMGKIIPTAKSYGVGLEQVATGYAIMTANGIATAESTTYMNSMMNELGKSGTKSADVLKEKTGKSFSELMEGGASLSDVLTIVNDAAKEQGIQFGDLFGSAEAAKAGMVLLGDSAEDFNGKLVEMSGASGTTQEAFDKLQTTSERSKIAFNQIKNSGIELGQTILEMLAPVLEKVATFIQNMTDKFNSLSPEMKNQIVIVGGIVAAIGPLLIILGKTISTVGSMVSTIGKASNAIKKFGDSQAFATIKTTAMSAVQKAQLVWTKAATLAQGALNVVMSANPIMLVVIAIAALVAGIIYLWNTNEDFRKALIAAWEAIKGAGMAVWNWLVKFFTEDIPNAFNAVVDFFANNWQTILAFIINPLGTAFAWCYENLEGFRNFIDTIVENVKTFIMNGFKAIGDFFTETIPQWIENISKWFNELPERIGYAIGYALGTIIKWGADCRKYLETNVPIWINSVVTFFSEMPAKIWNWLVNAYNRVVQWGSDMWKKVTEVATEFVNRIITVISQMPSRIWDKLTTAYNNVVTWGSNMWTKATEVGSTFVNKITTFFSELPSKIWNWLSQTIAKISNFASDAGAKAREAGGKIVDNVVNTIKSLPSKMLSIGKDIVQGLWNGITSMGSWMSDKISGFADGIVNGAKKALGIHSPSRVFASEVGVYSAQGVGVGFEEETDNVEDSVVGRLKKMTAKVKLGIGATIGDSGSAPMVNMMSGRSMSTNETNMYNDNSGVISKLDQLLGMWEDALPNLQPSYKVVMDTGAVVGQLAPQLDKRFGQETEYKGRGR